MRASFKSGKKVKFRFVLFVNLNFVITKKKKERKRERKKINK